MIRSGGHTYRGLLGAGDVFDQEPGPRVLVQALEEAEALIAAARPHAHNG